MAPPKYLQKGDIVSVLIAGKVFIFPVEGYFWGNRALIHLLAPTGFLLVIPVKQIVAVHGTDKNVIKLFSKDRPPICSQPSAGHSLRS